ncbi:MAG: hypothetical protein U0T33_01200 [Bacteroidales bacterium]
MNLDSLHVILFILIVLLAAYIVYLHIKIVSKNMIIESIVKKLSGIEKDLSIQDIRKIVNELHSLNLRNMKFDDRLFDESTLDFIYSSPVDAATYIHYTREEEVARQIMTEGFMFVESFYKTALPISADKLDLLIKHNNKKFYGDFIVVICISNEIVRHYSAEIEKAGLADYSFENILTEKPPVKNENSDQVFILPTQFIKGVVNFRTGEILRNENFNPGFVSPGFSKNIEMLVSGGKV